MRAFSEAIGDSSSNTNNYIGSRQTEPKPEYLSKVVNHFRNVNAHWLLTGEGEPFVSSPPTGTTQTGNFNQAGSSNKQVIKGNKGGIVGGSIGKAEQTNIVLSECERQRDAYKAEVDFLRQQLAMKDQLIEAKEEMLTLLRGSRNRPN
ncbi:hypothetical protein [Hymenobacter agri]